MKKIMLILLSLCLSACALFSGCSSSSGESKRIRITGDEVYAGELRRWISDRQQTYLEKDEQSSKEEQWFDFDMQMKMESLFETNGESVESTISYEMFGKMKIEYSGLPIAGYGEALFSYDLTIKAEVESVYIYETGEKEKEILEMEGELICVDNVCYADLQVKMVNGEEELEQSAKIKGDMNEILDFDFDLEEIIGSQNSYESQLYGVDITQMLDTFAGRLGVRYYLDEGKDTFFIDYTQLEESGNNKEERVIRYQIEYKNNSAVVGKEKIYLKESSSSSGSSYGMNYVEQSDMELSAMIKRISTGTIDIPEDVRDYEELN